MIYVSGSKSSHSVAHLSAKGGIIERTGGSFEMQYSGTVYDK
ncbi:hypothetical protein [Lysinibacillus sp. S2017]|nr:hypothetical protein [Lysinibacillus sp. S2017]